MDDDYINLDNYINHIEYFQFDLNNKNLKLNLVGKGEDIGDIIIKENFGKNNDYTISSCIYKYDEITNIKDKFIPLIKLYNEKNTYGIGIISYENIPTNNTTNNFDVFFIYKTNKFHKLKLEKDIDKSNIIEKLIDKLLDLNIFIL
jgi:hypothetical protein